MSFQPKTGVPCYCRPGSQRDNCTCCEGTGQRIDFARIRGTPLKMAWFNVYLGSKLIDSVPTQDATMTCEDMYRSLVEHDGYDPRIRVRLSST